MNSGPIRTRMEQKLRAAFAPTRLEIHDDSAQHLGHAGHNPLGESHFTVHITSNAFKDMNAVARHRAVYDVLADEIRERVHALSLTTQTPE